MVIIDEGKGELLVGATQKIMKNRWGNCYGRESDELKGSYSKVCGQ